MIYAKELRIGNLVYPIIEGKLYKTLHQVTAIHTDHACINGPDKSDGGVFIEYEELSPIMLTKEILLKCGFEINNSRVGTMIATIARYVPELSPISVIIDDEDGDLIGVIAFDKSVDVVFHLHQLQNLYFALTEKELDLEV